VLRLSGHDWSAAGADGEGVGGRGAAGAGPPAAAAADDEEVTSDEGPANRGWPTIRLPTTKS